jgi:hypothetical protein
MWKEEKPYFEMSDSEGFFPGIWEGEKFPSKAWEEGRWKRRTNVGRCLFCFNPSPFATSFIPRHRTDKRERQGKVGREGISHAMS